jgi:hypothetical protein
MKQDMKTILRRLDSKHLMTAAKNRFKKKSNRLKKIKVAVLTRTVDYQEFRFPALYKLHHKKLSFS